MKKVDICINVYGKQYQTLVTLKSLLKYNSDYINKIYLIEEAKQPHPTDFEFIKNELNYCNLVHFKPNHHLWVYGTQELLLSDEKYRHSIRYQYAFEKTENDFLFIIHNDVLFKTKFLDILIDDVNKNRYIGIGQLGQCWNCPLQYEKLCNADICQDVNLSNNQIFDAINKHQQTRTFGIQHLIDKKKPLPLPECRLNEWFAFINMQIVGKEFKSSFPFGGYGILDIGTEFYREAILSGFKFKNIDINEHCTHAYFSNNGNGHSSMSNDEKYFSEEELAKKYYLENYK